MAEVKHIEKTAQVLVYYADSATGFRNVWLRDDARTTAHPRARPAFER